MKLTAEVELKSIHDLVLLDTLIDAWKAKWEKEDKELKYEDADEESDDCDDESCEDLDDADAKAHEEALAKFAKCLRDSGIADISFTYCGSTKPHMKKK